MTVYLFYCDNFSMSAWNDGTWKHQSGNQNFVATLNLVRSEMGLSSSDILPFGHQVGLSEYEDLDRQLKLSSFQLPQVLFALPNPENPEGLFFVGKLVQGQINRQNMKVMLTAVLQLQPKEDPNGKISFYDPSFRLFDGIGISNSAGAPGSGALIGLNPISEALEINRGGQIFDNLKKLLPWAVLGAVLFVAASRRKKGGQ